MITVHFVAKICAFYLTAYKDAYNGIIDVCWNDFDDGFKRLLAVLNQVSQITLTKSFLTQIKDLINNSEKKGICHMLVNDGRIQWVLEND